jgi:DNA-binding PadR family transcriptional regulator
MTPMRGTPGEAPLGAVEFHVLLVLQDGALYGYALMKAVELESGGRLMPEVGSFYRVLSRMLDQELIDEIGPPRSASAVHPGRGRKYYRLTARGRAVARAEAQRLREVLELAAVRRLLPQGGEG